MHDPASSRYDTVVLTLFERLAGRLGQLAADLPFDKEDLDRLANDLRIKNVPDIIYSYKSGRRLFPVQISSSGNWIIEGRGKGKYAFRRLPVSSELSLPLDLEVTPIPDATPEIVLRFAKGDEQSILAEVRYNRLIDVFTGLTTYHMQSHIRAFVADMGQIEIDDLYLGVNTDGQWFCIPVEAKSASPQDQLGRMQIVSMVAYVEQEFPGLSVRPVGVKRTEDHSLFFAEFTASSAPEDIRARFYKRYALTRELKG